MAFHDRNRIQVQLWHFNRRISKVDSTTVKLLRLADPLVSFPVGSCKFEFLPWDSQVGLSANPSTLYDLANGLDFPALTEFIASKTCHASPSSSTISQKTTPAEGASCRHCCHLLSKVSKWHWEDLRAHRMPVPPARENWSGMWWHPTVVTIS